MLSEPSKYITCSTRDMSYIHHLLNISPHVLLISKKIIGKRKPHILGDRDVRFIAYKTVTHSVIFENEYQIKKTINIHRRIVVTF